MQEQSNAFISAARRGEVETVRALLEQGINVNQAVNNGMTALMTASRGGHVEVVKLLLQSKADPNLKMVDRTAPNMNVRTALLYVLIDRPSNILEIVRLLLSKGANTPPVLLNIAEKFHGQNSDVFRLLKDRKAKLAAANTLLHIGRLRMFPVAVPKDVTTLIAQAVVASREPWVPKK